MACYGRTTTRAWSRRTLRSACRQLIWCQARGMSVVAPTEGSETAISVVSVVICFPSLIGSSNALALKDQREVCSLSREGMFHPLSSRLQAGVRFFPHPLPTMPSVSLTRGFPGVQGHDRFTTFHMSTMHGLGPASPPVIVVSASGELRTPEPTTSLLVKLLSIFSLLSITTFISGSCSISHTMPRPSS